MASLLTNAQKTEISSVFDDLHDTFSREISIFVEGESVLIGIDDDYNDLYDRRKDSSGSPPTLEKHTAMARVKYFGEHEKGAPIKSSDAEFSYGDIRLKVNAAAHLLISSAKKIEVDGQLYRLRSGAARTGPFAAQYYVVYLQRGD
jgi:hypothetical protein